ncbi:MAG: hypothetical protein HOE05_04185, partial [Rhodospirillaceae bacterium]|nr:hypothetical protein [Rhodospirillaceae bacterium]
QPRRRRPAAAPEAVETPVSEATPDTAPEAVPEVVVVESETPAPAVAAVTEDAESN